MVNQFQAIWNPDDIERFKTLTETVYRRAHELLATEIWANIGREAPTDHGRLAGSFQIEQGSGREWRIYSNVEYALFVHEGTGIHGPTGHKIVPRTASKLVFEWRGKTWFLGSVAGQKPNPYADRAIDKAQGRVQEFIQRAIEEAGVT